MCVMVKHNKIPRSNYLRLVTLQARLLSVTKDFQSLRDNDCPCYLVTHKLEQCCDLFIDIIDYARAKI